jgi:regulator of protease activity HflC (stomatin/prohibitin superfamily)
MTVQIATFRRAIGRRRSTVAAFYVRNKPAVHVALLGIVFFIIIAWHWVVVTIPAGEVGVMWYRFLGGTDTVAVYPEGTHFVFPWDHMVTYNARLQTAARDFDVLTRDGLAMQVDVAVQFRLNPNNVGLLHKNIGPNYLDSLLMPTIGAEIREVVSRNSTDDTYTGRRSLIQDEIRRGAAAKLMSAGSSSEAAAAPWLFIDAVLIRSMRFPSEVETSINRKMQQYQLQEEYHYRLARERLESERKQIEAEGIARFQQIIGRGISENYLKWKGIDATLALAQSANAKVVVIGAGKDGMPLILGDAPAPATGDAVKAATTSAQGTHTGPPPGSASGPR